MKKIRLFVFMMSFSIICACASDSTVVNSKVLNEADATGEDNAIYSNSLSDIIDDDVENINVSEDLSGDDSDSKDKNEELSSSKDVLKIKEVAENSSSEAKSYTGNKKNSENSSDKNSGMFNMTKVEPPDFEPVYVYIDFESESNMYVPTGWMGDIGGLKAAVDCSEAVFSGFHCIKISYMPSSSKQWAGIYWQNPANNWGDKNGGYNLIGASKLTFYARGLKGNEIISEAKIGGISGTFADSDVAWIKDVRLSKKWKKYSIDLSKSDLSYISGGFCVVFTKKDNPDGCTIYLDEIKYE